MSVVESLGFDVDAERHRLAHREIVAGAEAEQHAAAAVAADAVDMNADIVPADNGFDATAAQFGGSGRCAQRGGSKNSNNKFLHV